MEFLASLPWKAQATKREKTYARRKAIREMAPRLGVTARTVRQWVAGAQKPIGIPLLKLRYLMDDYSHHASELDTIAPEVRSVGAIIARFDVDHKDVAQII